jgi:hypothetical protein
MREEITGWRDEEISKRHRLYGMNVPAVDVDFMLIEYDTGEPKAVIDYKRRTDAGWKRDSSNLKAMSRLYDVNGNQLPFFVAQYETRDWYYTVHAINAAAQDWFDRLNCSDAQLLKEYDFVRFLYILRGREMPRLDLFADQMQDS